MKVFLLIPPTNLTKSYGKLKKFSNPQPSIGIAYIAALLRKNGYEVRVADSYVNEYSLQEIMDIISQFAPDIVGISVLTPSAEVVYETSRNIRQAFSNIKIVMGNMHASLFSEEILSKGYADYVVHREGEYTTLELLNAIKNNSPLGEVKGISFLDGENVINNPLMAHIENLDDLPFPAWDIFPLERYSTDPRTEVKKGIVEMQILATRGCPNQCTFCSSRTERSLGTKYRMREPKFVVDEMLYMHDNFGSKVFSFMDLAFPLVKKHATELCNEIIKRRGNREICWVTECRVKPLDDEMLMLMKKAGCMRVNFGIESGNNDILRMLKKNFTTDNVRAAVKTAKKADIEVDGMFMIGLPGETEDTIRQTIILL
ncbi:MAG: radical SAM protein [Desulfobacterales bacterium]|nr:radical SAM protein [Desulfobacterales bacterium]